MATFRHPVTGVILNRIDVHRKALEPDEVTTAALLRRDGHNMHDIAAMLGINAGRVAEAIGENRKSGPAQPTLF